MSQRSNPPLRRKPQVKKNRSLNLANVKASTTHPPQLNNYQITHSVNLRFTVVAAATNSITYQNLLDTILLATTAIAPYQLFETVKVRKVMIWSQGPIGTPTTVSLQFNGQTAGSQGDRKVHTDTSLGVRPAFISASPSSVSLASKYQPSSTAVAFTLTAPAGSIIDVCLTFNDSPGTATAAQNASVGSVVGSVGFRGLDGLAASATNFPVPAGIYSI